ncbi:MAG: dephospho-CoA kinase [Firmicutes bacterium]|nr:dephospho-CoA kinase [Bacillota bacterium]
MRVGLTGGIASGKSTVAQWLVELGAVLIDADALVREVEAPGGLAYDAIVAYFGREILLADGQLNRKALGARIFSDDAARQALNAIVHPAVQQLQRERVAQLEQEPGRVILLDVPLLYEIGMDAWMHKVVVVWVPREVQIARLMQRNGLTRPEAEARVKSQMSLDEKRRRADYVIDNSGSLQSTRAQTERVWQELAECARQEVQDAS